MTYELKLCKEPFQAFLDGVKTIEMRLNDERRSLIKEGDFIDFSNYEDDRKIHTQVKKIYHYPNFEELYKNHCKTLLGYHENEEANPKDMLRYYTQERIDKYGVLGIEVELISIS